MQGTQLQYHEHDFLGKKYNKCCSKKKNHQYFHQLNLKEKRT